MRVYDARLPIALAAGAILVAVVAVVVSAYRDLTSLENPLLWVISLALSFVGSFYIGKQSAVEAARDIIKPHARSAFRRLISLYESLSRVGAEIESSRNKNSETITIAKLEAIVVEQLATADDALEDWRDIVPDEVAELRSKLTTARDREATK
ncbi:MAG: hypothetical protein IPN92_01810 [Chromatiaceae bacterium]|nr:hypothetical protein [Chromatiaceae bacterium]